MYESSFKFVWSFFNNLISPAIYINKSIALWQNYCLIFNGDITSKIYKFKYLEISIITIQTKLFTKCKSEMQTKWYEATMYMSN